ncbi:aminodeoxychorismate lyase [Xylanimonas cellulosilytica DSM 15894]|uniref:Endolytic murein transglycosylase n=1 Tax=Xylanimonas cellulosilytica (strain DSM 15894 / JCM 12276 / CECT 5975 / KCTC 9989 / LMG 20990 / NBRC 107835 / XIL07) TaxID=446471 RepID=D1BSM3_XYLCX|nr:endolytic transglycosylase MltG [Xylanimonas cellulosilytica]ACZ30715.1 aminodeoxychorismate lyase [Xylanimonas cellulosilytica DSM 15894]
MTDLFDHPAFASPPAQGARSAARRRAAAKRRRRRRLRTTLVVAVVLAVVGGVAVATWDSVSGLLVNPFSRAAEDYPGPGGASVEVEIPQGATGTVMGEVLVDAGVVASLGAFRDAFAQNPAAKGIQPGTYALLTEMKASDAVAALVKNEKIETKVTIPEGFTAAQALERITSVAGISKEDLDAAIADPESIGLPAEADGVVEGWLFPATYVVTPKDTAVTVLSQMIAKTLAELDAQGIAPENRLDILKKASIVEREAPPGFLGEVSRVIANRLDRGEPLGMDAVDAYGLGKPAAQITSDEFRDASLPYASRQHKGLPPTPIGNPGAAAIEAAANPPEGPWLWYVTVNLDSGETKFTDKYDEFQTYKKEFKAWEAAQAEDGDD